MGDLFGYRSFLNSTPFAFFAVVFGVLFVIFLVKFIKRGGIQPHQLFFRYQKGYLGQGRRRRCCSPEGLDMGRLPRSFEEG